MKFLYSTVVTAGKFITLLLAWVFYKIRAGSAGNAIKSPWLLLTITFPCVSLLIMTVIYPSYQGRGDLSAGMFAFSLGLAVANIAILYLVHRMEMQAQKEQEMMLLNQQMQIQTESILALEKSYRTQRQATHEFRHHLQTMGDLLENNDIKAAADYIKDVLNNQTERLLCVNSHHPVVDAVLNQKYQAARDGEIDMIFQVNDLSAVNLKADAIVVLLSNLLDNAIEACRKLETERVIQCRILAGDTLFISIRNTSLPVQTAGDTIPTSKHPPREHGFGLLNIRHILESLGAEYTYQYCDGWFEFVTEIPI
jgi:signal transduction histidine kinase